MTKHTCGGPTFGRLAPAGTCTRCDALRAGAEPVRQSWRRPRAEFEAAQLRAIRAHDCAQAGCAIVCTFGDW